MRKCLNCYWITQEEKMYCEKCGTKLTEVKEEINTNTNQSVHQNTKENVSVDAGSDVQLKKRLKKWKVCGVISIMLVVIMTIMMVDARQDAEYWRDSSDDKSAEIYSLKSKVSDLQEELDISQQDAEYWEEMSTTAMIDAAEMQEQIKFMDKYTAIIRTDSGDTTLYHTYECYKEWDEPLFRIYNVKAAENQGYSACPECH